MSAQRVTPVQWLRALAATIVVAAHAANLVDAGPVRITGAFIPSVPNLAVVGISGVDLFFVISGFVMAQSLATAPRDPWGFLVQRWRRIVPLFALASIAYILVATEPQPVEAMLMSITVLPLLDGASYHQPSLYVGWTLGFEFAFYALVALAMTARHHRTRWLLVATFTVALIGCIVQPGWAPVRLLFNPMQLEFAFGLLVWIAWRRGIATPVAAIAMVSGIALLAIGIAFGLGPAVSGDVQAAVAGTSGLARSWTWGLPWALVLLGVIDTPGGGRFDRIVARIGDASYSTYLVHPCLIALLWRIGGVLPDCPASVFVALFVMLSTVAGLIVHRWIERPLLRILARQRKAPAAAPVATDAALA